MEKDITIKTIQNDYSNELNGFIEENSLLNEDYFIEFKLKGLNKVIKTYEDVGEFFSGNDEFKYGTKATNRNLFGYYILYRDFLNFKKKEIKKPNNSSLEVNYLKEPINDKANELFEWLIEYYRPEENSSVKFVNILHYLKYDANKEFYIFNLKQKEYKNIINKRFGIDIRKFAKSQQYIETEKPILNSKERIFRNLRE